MKTPNLFIIGVHKAATTSLYNYLKFHKEIFVTPRKELHYFTPLLYNKSLKPLSTYLHNYKDAQQQKYLLDASPSYLYGKKALISELLELCENPKLILILRQPSRRFYSFFKQSKTMDEIPENESFVSFIEKSMVEFNEFEKNNLINSKHYNRSLREGCYSIYIEHWLQKFGDNIKIIYFEDFIQSPDKTMEQLTSWLEIENIYQNFSFTRENKSIQAKSVWMQNFTRKLYFRFEALFRKNQLLKKVLKKFYVTINTKQFDDEYTEETQKILNNFYHPYNSDLYKILSKYNRDLPRWND